MPPEYNLFAFRRGAITTPAGCGKTQLIADTLSQHTGAKPVLILTHTNAGVTTLRLRMQKAAEGSCSFAEATVRERERNRHESRPLAQRAIGSTLLLKGLEAEVAVITAPEEMDARHLYVAFTRGSKKLVVCSFTPVLMPR